VNARSRLPRLSLPAQQDIRCLIACARSKAMRDRLVQAIEHARHKLMEYPDIGIERGSPGERHLIVAKLIVVVYRIGRDGDIEVSRIIRAGSDY
jgi:plasmid stabilization system protein ParE